MLAAAEAAAPKWRRPTQRRRPRQGPTADVHPVAMAGGGGRTGKGTGNGSLPPPLMLVAVASGSRGAAVAAVGVAAGHRGAANRGGRPARRRRHGRAAAAAVVDGGSWGGGGWRGAGEATGGPLAADVGGEAGTLVAKPPLAAVDSRRPAHRPQTPIATGRGQLPNPKRLQTAGGRRHRRRGKAPRPSEKGKLRQGGCVICHRYTGDSLQCSGVPAIRYPFLPQGVSDVDGVKTTRQMTRLSSRPLFRHSLARS